MKNQLVGAGDVRVRRNFCGVPNRREASGMGVLPGVHCKVWSRTGKSREEWTHVWGLAPHRGIDVGVDDQSEYVVNDKYLNKEG